MGSYISVDDYETLSALLEKCTSGGLASLDSYVDTTTKYTYVNIEYYRVNVNNDLDWYHFLQDHEEDDGVEYYLFNLEQYYLIKSNQLSTTPN